VKSLALALVGLAAVVGIASVTASGCATATSSSAATTERPADYEPDGGWVNYRPQRRPYEVDPARSVSGFDRTPSPTSPNPM
jgi:hypothetical protein